MESVGDSDPALHVRHVRSAALAARPPAAPLPHAGAQPVDAGGYWLAAQQYFEAAERLYRGGDAKRGDYCIVRGDAYVRLATLCGLANGSGVRAGVSKPTAVGPARPAGQDAAALRARMEYLCKLHPVELPTVPLDAADENPCLGFLDNALEHADAAEAAFAAGDLVAGHYYSSEVDADLLLLYICEQVVYGPAA